MATFGVVCVGVGFFTAIFLLGPGGVEGKDEGFFTMALVPHQRSAIRSAVV
jgi:hypothetical protein